jgi:hypothetical protein
LGGRREEPVGRKRSEYGILGRLLNRFADRPPHNVRGPYALRTYMAQRLRERGRDPDGKDSPDRLPTGAAIRKYYTGETERIESSFLGAFADIFELDDHEKMALGWVNTYRTPPESDSARRPFLADAGEIGVALERLHNLGIPTNASEVSILGQCIGALSGADLVEDDPVEWERIGWLLAYILATPGMLTEPEIETARETARGWLVGEKGSPEEPITESIGSPLRREKVLPLVTPRRIGRPESRPEPLERVEFVEGLYEAAEREGAETEPREAPVTLTAEQKRLYDEFFSAAVEFLLVYAKKGEELPLRDDFPYEALRELLDAELEKQR